MLFWIFVIIGVLSAIIGISICYNDISDELKERKDAAWETYYLCSTPNRSSPDEWRKYDEKRDALKASWKKAEDDYDNYVAKNSWRKKVGATCAVILGIAIGAIVIMLLVLTINYATAPGERARLEANYETLTWEVENQVYNDGGDDVVGKKELYNQVREYNAELAANQYYEKNFWVGIFCPNIYGDLKPIELK